ncbi:MAG: NAD(P)H-quinone oxidoreductase [bacterium]|nr:NAD(P)H-quinone oxidoreductase [bacterium]
MLAISIDNPGVESTFRLADVPAPTLGPGELQLNVMASGVNRADLVQRRGLYPPPPGASLILGLECSGRVTKIGEQVVGWSIGDRATALLAGGGYATEVVVPAENAWHVSEHLSDIEAAAIPEAFLTAFSNLVLLPDLQPGQSVLIHGGSGGVGTAAIQLAKRVGAQVAVTTGAIDRCDRCVSLGADLAVDYHDETFVQTIKKWTPTRGLDVILDCVGAPYFASHLDMLGRHGTLAIIGLMGGRKAEIDLAQVLLKNLTIRGTTLRSQSTLAKGDLVRAMLSRFGTDFDTGVLHAVVEKAYPLELAEQAHRELADGGVFGKLILTTPNSR